MAQVLVVDDDPHIGKTLVDLLSLHGYVAERAESGERGLEALAGGRVRPGAARRAAARA